MHLFLSSFFQTNRIRELATFLILFQNFSFKDGYRILVISHFALTFFLFESEVPRE